MDATLTNSVATAQSAPREQLIAHWDLVDGKLICKWNVISPAANQPNYQPSNIIHFPQSHHAA